MNNVKFRPVGSAPGAGVVAVKVTQSKLDMYGCRHGQARKSRLGRRRRPLADVIRLMLKRGYVRVGATV